MLSNSFGFFVLNNKGKGLLKNHSSIFNGILSYSNQKYFYIKQNKPKYKVKQEKMSNRKQTHADSETHTFTYRDNP